jgi:hypothetical protein
MRKKKSSIFTNLSKFREICVFFCQKKAIYIWRQK